jgi:hypothetical protein
MPSLAGMVTIRHPCGPQIHGNTNYTTGCPTIKRGIEVNTFQGIWAVPAWEANLTVSYYWSGPLGDFHLI